MGACASKKEEPAKKKKDDAKQETALTNNPLQNEPDVKVKGLSEHRPEYPPLTQSCSIFCNR